MLVYSYEAQELHCRYCRLQFYICRPCYRGQRYCSPFCRDRGYNETRRQARCRYAKSTEARLDHRDRNRRYRLRKKKITSKSTTSVTDQSSIKRRCVIFEALHASRFPQECCQACGRRLFDQRKGGISGLGLFPVLQD